MPILYSGLLKSQADSDKFGQLRLHISAKEKELEFPTAVQLELPLEFLSVFPLER